MNEYVFTVVDEIAPQIKVKKAPAKNYKVGNTYTIDGTAMDNFEGDIILYALVKDAQGILHYAEMGTEVRFTKAGDYEVRYIAFDVRGNTMCLVYKITVTK